MNSFISRYRTIRCIGLPIWWSIKIAWAARKGPNAELRKAWADYQKARRAGRGKR